MTNSAQMDEKELLDLLLLEEAGDVPPPALVHRPGPAPLSRAQTRLWFLQHLAPESSAYHIPCAVRFTGKLDAAALEAGLNAILQRHEALRTCFTSVEGKPVPEVHGECNLPLPLDDLSGLADAEAELHRRYAEEVRRPFDLGQAPLLRARLFKLDDCEHVAVLVLHHIVADGWSIGVLLRELTALYQAFLNGNPCPLPELPVQYGDFARWQAEWLTGDEAAEQRSWWKARLAGLEPLELPTDRPRPTERSDKGASLGFSVPQEVTGALKKLGRQEGASLFMTLLAAFAVLLHRYSGQDDFAVGSPVANRNRREVEPLIGFFVNTLALRCDLSGQPSFREVLRRVRDFTLEALARQDFPFDEVVKEAAPDRAGTGNPLFQVMFLLEKAPAGALELPGLSVTPVDFETRTAKFDLLLNMSETVDGLSGAFEYATELFDAGTIARMAGHFTTLLKAAGADPETPVATLPLLSADEHHRLLIEWNRTATPFPADRCIHELFEAEARARPNAVAVEFLDRRLSYGELDARADRLARRLRALGVGPGQRVALLTERSPEMVIALLGILKAGGAYVPLSPDDPDGRLDLLLRDVGPAAVLAQERFAGRSALGGWTVLPLVGDEPALPAAESGAPVGATTPDQLAYVLYTSGSTGTPKGVCVSHRSVVRLVRNTDYAHFGPDEVFLQLAPLAFDASTLEIWGPLLNGGTLAVAPPHRLSLTEIGECIRRHRVTTLWLTAGLFHAMVDESLDSLKPLRQLLAGGDVLSVPHVLKAVRALDGCRLINGYGPTENTTFTCCYAVTEPERIRSSVPIGRPIANTTVYILDRFLQPVPIGVPGELCIGGAGLALGYLGRPDLTEACFIDNPHGEGKLYRSGDLARWLPDGVIEFIGRRDSQVKIRGFRIELGEIEAALNRHPAVREAVVLAREIRPNRRELVAYVVAKPGSLSAIPRLQSDLAEQLPDYMVPARYVSLPALPLNENGKVDRHRLPAPEDDIPRSYTPPRDAREEALAEVWRGVLGCREEIGIHDNYFSLGGDSITAIQVVSRLKRHGFTMRVADLFHYPSIAQLAPVLRLIDGETDEEDGAAGEVPLTAVQRWFFEHYPGEERRHFNQAVLLRCSVEVDEHALARVLAAWIKRHDALRLSFSEEGGTVRQTRRAVGESPALATFDLRRDTAWQQTLERHADALQAGLDLERGPLLQAGLFRCPDGDRALLVIHHLAVDGVSWRVLLDELEPAYRQAAAGQAVDLGPKTCSFGRWAWRMQNLAQAGRWNAERAYWRGIETAAAGRLPLKPTQAPSRYGDVQTLHVDFDEQETRELLTAVHAAYQTELLDILLTGLGLALRRWTGASSTLIDLEGHGREPPDDDLDVSGTVGWFTSIYPFLLDVPGDDPAEQIRAVKSALRAIPGKGLGYGMLRYLSGGQDWTSPAPRLGFNYLGQFEEGTAGGLFSLCDEPSGRAISPHLPRAHSLEIVGLIAKGRLMLSLEFSPAELARETAAALLDDLREQVRILIRHCLAVAPQSAPWADRFPNAEVEDAYPLAPLQKGLLFQSLLDPNSEAYFVQMTFRFQGVLDSGAFRRALDSLAKRHAVLRSAFLHRGLDEPVQVVLRERPPELAFHDLRGMDEPARRAWLDDFRQNDRRRGFDLEREELLRVSVFRCAEDAYEMVWSYHHILLDGWCLSILQRDFLELYAALLDGRPPRLPATVPYRRYIQWLDWQDRHGATVFWREYLDGYEQAVSPPRFDTGEARMPRQICVDLDTDTSAQLTRFAARTGVTLNAVIRGLWGLLLARYSGCEDIVFGSIVSGRPADLEGVEEMVGLFINAVPVRMACKRDQSFAELVRAVQESALTCEPHQHLPLTDIQAQSPLGRSLFDHLLVFENYPLSAARTDEESANDWRLSLVSADDPTHYDFNLTVVPGESIGFKFAYNAAIYPDEGVRRIAAHLRRAVDSVLDDPHKPLRDVDILPADEHHTLLAVWSQGVGTPAPAWCVHQALERQAALTPDATALVHGEHRLSYGELNAKANRLARHLVNLGVAADRPVGLCLERSFELLIGLFAILKAGGAYVPLDPDLPAERLRLILDDAEPVLLLTQTRLAERFPGRDLLCLDALPEAVAQADPANLDRLIRGEDLAYLLYTSGSTGQPKGCALEHRQLAHYLDWANRAYYPDDTGGAFALYTAMGFDLTVTSLFLPLLRGKILHLFPQEWPLDQILRAQFAPTSGIDSVKITPAHLTLLAQLDLPATAIEVAVIGGEQVLPEHARTLWRLNPGMRLYNEYGPTEATVGCIVQQLHPEDARIRIGRPIDRMQVYVLDDALQLVPVGVSGQLYLGGAGLARGYWRQPDLTGERFIAHPYRPGERLYASGDVARWGPDGTLECLGRIDQQVKLRGFRIELGEIEAALHRHPGVRQAVVVVRDTAGGKHLIAYVVADAGWSASEARDWLKRTLPDYMVPQFFVALESLPLTPNGKLDRRALPDPLADGQRQAPTVHPATPTEIALAAIWRQVLQVDDIGAEDNFFELGGHSLKAMQIVSQIHRTLGVSITLSDLFEHPRLNRLAALIEQSDRSVFAAIPVAPAQEYYELSHAQRRLWMLHQMDGASAYNIPIAGLIHQAIDRPVLEAAFARLIQRHESLRTGFVLVDGEPRQRIHAQVPFQIEAHDLLADEDPLQRAREIADAYTQAPFDLTAPPLLRAALIRLPGERSVFVMTMHHIVGDGWSGNVLFRELLGLYEAYREGRPDPLKPLRIQYKDFAVWQNARGFRQQEEYWLAQLAGMPDRLALPYDLTPSAQRSFQGGIESLELDAEVAGRLRALAVARGTTLSNVFLALFNLFLFHWTRQDDICIGLSIANRNHPDLENLIGFFVNILPIRCRLSEDMEFDQLLDQVIQRAHDAFEQQDYPFDLLVEKLNPSRVSNQQPLVNVIYGFQNFTDVHIEVQDRDIGRMSGESVAWEEFDFSYRTSKFDLTLFVTEEAQTVRLTFEYDSQLFLAATIREQLKTLEHFAGLLANLDRS